MIEQSFLQRLSRSDEIRYYLHTTPVGDLFLIGDAASIRAIVFKDSHAGRWNIEKHFTRGDTADITSARYFLDDYFSRASSSKTTDAGSYHFKTDEKNSLLLIRASGFSLRLDLSGFTPKEIAVFGTLTEVRVGMTVSYGGLAKMAGFPGGARFVGNAMAKNIFPIIIPCHRVIRSGGSIGNYSGGRWIKEYLLEYENKLVLLRDN